MVTKGSSFSEDQFGKKVDRCITDTLVKAGMSKKWEFITFGHYVRIPWIARSILSFDSIEIWRTELLNPMFKFNRGRTCYWFSGLVAVFQTESIPTLGWTWFWIWCRLQELWISTEFEWKILKYYSRRHLKWSCQLKKSHRLCYNWIKTI